MLLGLWGPLKSKSMENGKLMDFCFSILFLLNLFPHVLWSVLLVFWIMIGSQRLPWMGRLDLDYLKCKGNVFVGGRLLWAAAEANTESNVMRILWVFKAGQHYSVVHFYSSNLLGPIMIRELSLHLWTSTCVYQDLICLGPFNLIFLALH